MGVWGGDVASMVLEREVSLSFSFASSSGEIIRMGFGFGFSGEGEDIRDRFFGDPPSDALDPFVGVDRRVFSPKGLKAISLTIAPAETEVSKDSKI